MFPTRLMVLATIHESHHQNQRDLCGNAKPKSGSVSKQIICQLSTQGCETLVIKLFTARSKYQMIFHTTKQMLRNHPFFRTSPFHWIYVFS